MTDPAVQLALQFFREDNPEFESPADKSLALHGDLKTGIPEWLFYLNTVRELLKKPTRKI